MAKVFIIEQAKVDISAAKEYGELFYIFHRHDNRCSIWNTPLFQRLVLESLEKQEYNPDEDLFLIVGGIVPLTLATTAIHEKYGKIRALFFDSVNRAYNIKDLPDASIVAAISQKANGAA